MKKLFTLICLFALSAGTVLAQEVYTEFTEDGTLTFYYDSELENRSGLTEVYDPIGNPDADRFDGYASDVYNVIIDPSMMDAPLTSTKDMFYGLSSIGYIEGLEMLNTENVTDMSGMFAYCENIENLDLTTFNTENVTDMNFMFYRCSYLTSLELSSFNTQKVTDMSGMFYGCSALTELDLSVFNTENARDMSGMFGECRSLTYLDLSGFNTENVKDMSGMFNSCTQLTELNISKFDTGNVTDMHEMFSYCGALEALNITSFNTKKVTDMHDMFNDCEALTELDLTSFNTEEVTNMKYIFNGCKSLTALDLNSFSINNVENMISMFGKCSALKTITCSKDWSTTGALSNMMFYGCTALVGSKGTVYDDAVTDKTYARPDGGTGKPGYFTGSGNIAENEIYTVFDEGTLTYYYDDKMASRSGEKNVYDQEFGLNISNQGLVRKAVIDPSMKDAKLYKTCNMFPNLFSMESIEGLENLNTSNVTNMANMFSDCGYLESLDLSSFNTENVTDMSSMFSCCSSLTTIICDDDWSKSSVLEYSYNMFYGCTALVGGKGTAYDSNFIDATYARPDGGTGKPGYFTGSGNIAENEIYTVFDEGTLTYYYDDKMASRSGEKNVYDQEFGLNISNQGLVRKAVIDPSMKDAKLYKTCYMFPNLFFMESIEGLENLNTSNVTNMANMFSDCGYLESLDLSSFNTENVTDMSSMFSCCSSLTTIICDDDWSKSSVLEDSYNMFYGCTALVGGKGTAYDSNFIDATYARPDGGTGAPGYFTEKIRAVYTEFVEATGTLTYYYDDQMASRPGVTEVYDPIGNPSAVRFTGYYKKVLKAVIDPSMKDAPLTSMYSIFFGGINNETFAFQALSKMTEIKGMENLNTADVTRMDYMFEACNALKTVDVNSFDISKVTKMDFMFGDCYELTTIYCSKDWSSTSASSDNMFAACRKLVGGNGTAFDSNVIDATYARPDGGTERPGYFTAVLVEGDLNGDGKVDIADAVAVLEVMAKDGNDPEADLNGDGKVDIADFVAVLEIMAKQ